MYAVNFLEKQYAREVKVVVVDFSDGMKVYPSLAEQLQHLDIGILSKPEHNSNIILSLTYQCMQALSMFLHVVLWSCCLGFCNNIITVDRKIFAIKKFSSTTFPDKN